MKTSGFQGLNRICTPVRSHQPNSRHRQAAFSLIEVMITLVLLLILTISSFSAIYFNTQASYRLGDRIAAMGLVQAKMEAVRAATYKPPNSPFCASTVYLTNSDSIALDKAGTKFLVPGTIVTKFEPVALGHLVTVTGTFATPGRPFVVQAQSVINKFSGAQQ